MKKKEPNAYKKSQKWFERSCKTIPSGIYGYPNPAEEHCVPTQAHPLFSERAEGTYIWDVDGNRFIDYMCAYGSNILGYNDDEVNAAVLHQIEDGNCMSLPSYKMVECAELISDTINMADWVFFAKNGSDITSLAVMVARAATGRSKIISFEEGYYGTLQWWQPDGSQRVNDETRANVIKIPWNDLDALKQAIAENDNNIAGVISTPYKQALFVDNDLPEEGFWQSVREICTEKGIVLIIDEARTGFRLNIKGSDYHYGFKSDLMCFSKALANGYNISCLCGINSLKETISSITYTGAYWLSAISFAAAIATIQKIRKIDTAKITRQKGVKLTEGLRQVSENYGFDLKISGEPSMWYMRLANDPKQILHQEWVVECLRRNIFFTAHHNQFVNTALSKLNIQRTIDVADQAFTVLRKNHPDA